MEHYRSISEYDIYKGGGTPYRVTATFQVQYIETKLPIFVICFLIGVGSKYCEGTRNVRDTELCVREREVKRKSLMSRECAVLIAGVDEDVSTGNYQEGKPQDGCGLNENFRIEFCIINYLEIEVISIKEKILE